MPIYEYECPHCVYIFEVKQGFEARTDVQCPQCRGLTKRIMSKFSFSFTEKKRQSQAIARRVNG